MTKQRKQTHYYALCTYITTQLRAVIGLMKKYIRKSQQRTIQFICKLQKKIHW